MKYYLSLFILFLISDTLGQIPVEIFVGDKKASADLMFFRFIKSGDGTNSEWLFFNRNRSVVDYKMNSTTYLPAFGHTMAFSYNNKHFIGFAPVSVLQINNSGVTPKLGMQYAHSSKEFLFFSWAVNEVKEEAMTDFFFLFRFSPPLNEDLNLFLQIESFNALPLLSENNLNLVQRLRIGIKMNAFQVGAGVDLNELGKNTFKVLENYGLFLRYEY
ncbi:MAG: hypothetical protein HUU54_16875 [Ignavibacteriaceae bacterium]|nr:hypothetical protein [Ignavibacteriaceae bacterium]